MISKNVKRKRNSLAIPLESYEQKAFVNWAKLKSINGIKIIDYLIAIPNGGSRKRRLIKGKWVPTEALNLKLQGLLVGAPDIFIALPVMSYHGLFIEMKRRKGGIISPEQMKVITRLRNIGYYVEVAHGWEAAVNITESYIKCIL